MTSEDYIRNIEEDTDPSDDGEVIKTLKDFKIRGEEMIASLEHVDDILSNIERRLEMDETISKSELLNKINEIRKRIGNVKEEEQSEIGEEKVVINLLNKLRKWVQEMT